jgi:putative hydrolase of the HAD superfamily
MMKACKYLFFDCMETLIDLYKLPAIRDYAAWAYEGSGLEGLWEGLDEFFRYYLLSKQELGLRLPERSEYEMRGRFLHLVQLSLPDLSYEAMESTAGALYRNYWRNYKAGTYIKEDVKIILPKLREHYRTGVVSNFMVMGGIEELLEMHGIREHFDFVVTSVAEGWRKPHRLIYERALELAGVTPGQVTFVGDDFENDYLTPSEMGMQAIYLDRYGKHPELESRVTNYFELWQLLTSNI